MLVSKGMLSSGNPMRRKSIYGWICQACRRSQATLSSPSTSSNLNPSTLRKLPTSPARTRFAPSPTGYLHLGSLRTALFNYLLAKSTGGQFLLRIEDTDQKRTVRDAEDQIFEDLKWLGLQWDEGPQIGGQSGPYNQSQRTALYRKHAEILLRSGHAYRCFCSPDRLHALAKQRTELGLPTDYDRSCTHLSTEESEGRAAKGEAHVVRFKVPAIYPQFTDLVYGKVKNRKDQSRKVQLYPAFEDPVLLKSDGFPTYHLANVVDDHHMKITHVVRGAEWMSSTPKHLAMYDAFHWTPPAFAHVGLLLDDKRQKLSKRNFDLDVSSYRNKMGVFPETLANFVALLGWSHGQRNDIMDLQQLVEIFDMRFTKGDTVVTFEKLWFLQRAHAERYASAGNNEKLSLMTKPIIAELNKRRLANGAVILMNQHSADIYVLELLRVDARNYTNAPGFVERNKFFFEKPDRASLSNSRHPLRLHQVPEGVDHVVSAEDISEALSPLELITSKDWAAENIRKCIADIVSIKAELSLDKLRDSELDIDLTMISLRKSWSRTFHQYLRWAIAAGMPGPDGAESLGILGREETLARLKNASELLSCHQSDGFLDPDTGNVKSPSHTYVAPV